MNIKLILKKLYVNQIINNERKREEDIIMKDIPLNKRIPLTEAEKGEIHKMWGAFTNNISYKEFEVFKYFNGFDARYLSHNLYLPLIARTLNNFYYTKFFEDKGLSGHISSNVKFPESIVRCIDGEYYDADFKQISRSRAIDICKSAMDYGLIIKPSRESAGQSV